MQAVSKEYKKRIRDQLRNTGYMMISFGVVNQKAQSKAVIDSHGAYHALTIEKDLYRVFSQEDNSKQVYGSLEEDFTPVDASYLFPPRGKEKAEYTGIISEDMIVNGVFRLEVNLGETPFSFKGFTIDFGENYPKRITLETDTGVTIEGTPTGAVYKTEQVFKEVKKIIITISEMIKPHTRVRIRSILIGYGLLYTNNHIIDSSLESHSSPIGAECPQIDFSVTLNNRDRYFDVDNPNSAINFLEIGQELTVFYGYNLGESIEWVKGATLECSSWESDEHIARIKAVDKLRRWDSIYVDSNNNSMYLTVKDKIDIIMKTIGMSKDDLYIDPYLAENDHATAPIPNMKVREALQLLANKSRSILYIDRDGKVGFRTRFKAHVTVRGREIAPWGNINNIYGNTVPLLEYAVLDEDSITLDGKQLFYPRNPSAVDKRLTGHLVRGGEVLSLELNVDRKYYSLKLEFGDLLPLRMVIFTSNSQYETEGMSIVDITKNMVIPLEFNPFNRLSILFLVSEKSLVQINSIELGDETDFTIGKWDMLSSPKAIKQEPVKDIIVKCYNYFDESVEWELTPLLTGEQDVVAGTTIVVPTKDCTGQAIVPDENTEWVEVLENNFFSKKFMFKKTGKVRFDVKAWKIPLRIMEITKSVNREGKTIIVDNPLVGSITQAELLANWLADYYSSKVAYEYDTRGFPELDVNDYIFQENDFEEDLQSEVTDTVLTFNGAWRGKIKARRREK